MATFIGTNANETITPGFVSPTVYTSGGPAPGVGPDTIDAGGGDDTVAGGHGNDVILLGAGNDLFIWSLDDDNDLIEGAAGFDRISFIGSAAMENIFLWPDGQRADLVRDLGAVSLDVHGVERFDIHALGGADLIGVGNLAGTGIKTVFVDLEGALGGGAGDGAADFVGIDGNNAANFVRLTGSGTTTTVSGFVTKLIVAHSELANDTIAIGTLAGNDTIDARSLTAGIKVLIYGGNGNDSFLAGPRAETLEGGNNADLASYAASPTGVNANLNGLACAGGYAAGDILNAVERLTGSDRADILVGSDFGNILRGLNRADTLLGNAGVDLLIGGRGKDSMIGGGQADRFDFNAIVESVVGAGRDVIDFFSHAEGDRIDLATIDADQRAGHPGNQAFVFIGAQTFAAHAGSGEVRKVGGVIQINVDADNAAEMEIAIAGALVAGDFVL